jgi:hypothetical protein
MASSHAPGTRVLPALSCDKNPASVFNAGNFFVIDGIIDRLVTWHKATLPALTIIPPCLARKILRQKFNAGFLPFRHRPESS